MEMICPTCKTLNQTSSLVQVFYGYGKSGHANIYIDEKGQDHNHDPNFSMNLYECSAGHEIKVVTYSKCYKCDYKGGETRLVNITGLLEEIK